MISDRGIRTLITEGRVTLESWDSTMVQPASIDVRLDRYFRLFDNRKYAMIGSAKEQLGLTRFFGSGDKPPILHPGGFILGSTFEHVTLPDSIATRLEGRSSLGRLGSLTHSTAGFIDLGFTERIILGLSNAVTMPIALHPRVKTR